MNSERAECGNLPLLLARLSHDLEQYQRFEFPDALNQLDQWRSALSIALPEEGVGIDQVLTELGRDVIPNGSQIPNPGCTSFITTGATTIGALATLAGAVASPQRIGVHAFNLLEEISLQWLMEMFELPPGLQGIYSSGGSVANLIALGAARQSAFERIGIDPAREGVNRPCRIYTTEASHHTILRAAAVLGMGRASVFNIPTDMSGCMLPEALQAQIKRDAGLEHLPVAIVANAGTTSCGAIDPLQALGRIAHAHGIWFHVDGAYGLPGILDPEVKPKYEGLQLADSVTVDPHKWLGAPVGIGATFVRDRALLHRAFTQEISDYLEGAFCDEQAKHSLDQPGYDYNDLGVELSAPSRGAVVWALIREIGKQGMAERVCRHNAMARSLAERAHAHPNLEVVQEPTLSICCFRYVDNKHPDLNALNHRIHRQMIHNGRAMPSTAMVNGILAIRPCFVGARTTWKHVDELIEEVVSIGQRFSA